MASDMKTDVWMPLFIGDYMTATSRLTTEQHGAYLLLIMDYWKNGPLPDNDQILAQITRMRPDAWSNARAVLAGFFKVANGQWRHSRIEKEMAEASERKGKAKDKARKAAEARWAASGNATSNATSNAIDMLEQCPSPSPSPSPSSLPLPSESPQKDSAGAQADKPAKVSVTARDLVNDYGISKQHAAEWMAVRKAKRLTLTKTAMDNMITEAGKAGLTLNDAIQMCIKKSWGGFEAKFLKDSHGGQRQETPQERGERMARERGYTQ